MQGCFNMTNARDYKGPLAGKSVTVAPGFVGEFNALYAEKGMQGSATFKVISDFTLSVSSVQGSSSRIIAFTDPEGHVSTSGAHRFLVLE
jgi:hypothetical protein